MPPESAYRNGMRHGCTRYLGPPVDGLQRGPVCLVRGGYGHWPGEMPTLKGYVFNGRHWYPALEPCHPFVIGPNGRIDGRIFAGPTTDVILYFEGFEIPNKSELTRILRRPGDTMDPKTIAADVLKELISDIPAIAGAVHQWAGIKGFDLGPAPPNARTGVEAVDADIDAQLEALKGRG